jgi:hypothetical protein
LVDVVVFGLEALFELLDLFLSFHEGNSFNLERVQMGEYGCLLFVQLFLELGGFFFV